jgi:GNAT superfamily N-acetyltransferase
MISDIQISSMQEVDIIEAKNIWVRQYELYCSDSSFPLYWKEETELLEKFLKMKIQHQSVFVAKHKGRLVGFLAYDTFPFNGENSVFCPTIGHAAVEEYKESVYLALYKSISQQWVNQNIFNHMWTIFYNDLKLKAILFDLGYGSYLIDAMNNCDIKDSEESIYEIRVASAGDADVLYELVRESNDYYASAPLFLKRDEVTIEEIEEIITKNAVFIAWEQEIAIGFMSIRISERNNFIDLSVKNCGLIDEIGAYIKADYRNKKIGIKLLKHAADHCRAAKAAYIHVDFETANLYANKFWGKYFTPMLLSMRRTVNKNINER